jgi:hypothetical protein
MVLDPIAGKDLLAAVVQVDGHRDDDCPLWIEKPVAIILRNGEVVGDDMELLAGHLEDGPRIKALHQRSSPPKANARRARPALYRRKARIAALSPQSEQSRSAA